MCERCSALEERVAALELELADRLDGDRVALLMSCLQLTLGQAKLVAALHQAGRYMPVWALAEALKIDHARDYASDHNMVSVQVCKIRRVWGADFLETARNAGVRLSREARNLVGRVLESGGAYRPEPPAARSRKQAPPIDWRPMLPDLRSLHAQGRTYKEIAGHLGVNRSAVGGAIYRFINHPAGAPR